MARTTKRLGLPHHHHQKVLCACTDFSPCYSSCFASTRSRAIVCYLTKRATGGGRDRRPAQVWRTWHVGGDAMRCSRRQRCTTRGPVPLPHHDRRNTTRDRELEFPGAMPMRRRRRDPACSCSCVLGIDQRVRENAPADLYSAAGSRSEQSVPVPVTVHAFVAESW
ncbi:hypothetical protein SORBI_3001G488950 [Sorghum bicolor]|uniref:Uncharacterized protein n=1 Tax=Sorghum bicolor TaxID=4558 RepID=A0A1Z5SB77_SORBI|nr:hypothetical protein SORBI_3001G488950 [Sorghum bicolor]